MRISIAADELTGVAEEVEAELRRRGRETLALSLRSTAPAELTEILDAWLHAAPSDETGDRANVAHIGEIEQR